MSSIGLNRRKAFLDGKMREVFGDRDVDVDQMIEDLVREGRQSHIG
jgi:hypothetical protein